MLSAFLGSHGEKGGGFLVHFKRLLAVFAIEFIARHRTSKTTKR
jgi:hypothetical protein